VYNFFFYIHARSFHIGIYCIQLARSIVELIPYIQIFSVLIERELNVDVLFQHLRDEEDTLEVIEDGHGFFVRVYIHSSVFAHRTQDSYFITCETV
jgi:hypothetical protein